jgi:hypothetical protein
MWIERYERLRSTVPSHVMAINKDKKSNSRLVIAASLFLTSIVASAVISYLSQTGSQYWILTRALPQGVSIESADLSLVRATLDNDSPGYLSGSHSVVGLITRRTIYAGEMLRSDAITRDRKGLVTQSLSLLIRSADIPASARPGDVVTLYQIHDSRNGEEAKLPTVVLSGVFISEIDGKSANFGSDISLTISLNRDDVATVLAATSSGRIVVVPAHG